MTFTGLLSLGGFLGDGCLHGRSLGGRSLNGFSLLGAATASGLGFFLGERFQHVLVVVNEFDDGHCRIVTVTDAGLQDAGVATGTVSNLLRDFAEELVDGLFAVEVAEDNTAVVGGVLFGAIDEGLDIYSECFGLCQRGLNSLLKDERGGHVGEHSNAMCVGS